MVWIVDYSDLDNLTMTQIATERFLHDGGWDATKRYLLLAANMRDQMVVVDTQGEEVSSPSLRPVSSRILGAVPTGSIPSMGPSVRRRTLAKD